MNVTARLDFRYHIDLLEHTCYMYTHVGTQIQTGYSYEYTLHRRVFNSHDGDWDRLPSCSRVNGRVGLVHGLSSSTGPGDAGIVGATPTPAKILGFIHRRELATGKLAAGERAGGCLLGVLGGLVVVLGTCFGLHWKGGRQ